MRRILVKIHLWTGLAAGLYVLLISVTGSAVIFRREFSRWALTGAAGGAFPWYMVAFEWVVDLHDNLLAGRTGRLVNGIGAIAVLAIAITGLVIWWRGAGKWWRGMVVKRGTGLKRFTFDLHSALGFWLTAFLLIWALSGIYFAFPHPFQVAVEFFEPEDLDNPVYRRGDWLIEWMVKLHFGRFGGVYSRVIWTIIGLVPAALFVTGIMMWWQRVMRPRLSRRRSPMYERVTPAPLQSEP